MLVSNSRLKRGWAAGVVLLLGACFEPTEALPPSAGPASEEQLNIPRISLDCEVDVSDHVSPMDLGGTPILLSGGHVVVASDATGMNNRIVNLASMTGTRFPDGYAVQVAGPGRFLFAEWNPAASSYFVTDGFSYRSDLAKVEGSLEARRPLRAGDYILGRSGYLIRLIGGGETVDIDEGGSQPDSFGRWSGWIAEESEELVVMDPVQKLSRLPGRVTSMLAYPSGVLFTRPGQLATFTGDGAFRLWERPTALIPSTAGAFAFALDGSEELGGAFIVGGPTGLVEVSVPAHVALPLSVDASSDWIAWSVILGNDACPRQMGMFAAAVEEGAPLLWLGSDSTDCAEASRPLFLIGDEEILIILARGGSARVRLRDLPRGCRG